MTERIQYDHNGYPGINAHLHSLLQVQGGWDEFHTAHIVHLAAALKRQLRPLGYTARIEQALCMSSECDTLESVQYWAIAIYTSDTPVTWLELLSPSNKPGGQDAAYYRDKRLKLLRAGMVFVELDYLHHSAPTFKRIATYTPDNANAQASPYRIIVVDPRPTFDDGQVVVYPIGIDAAIAPVNIPLRGDDGLRFDFNAPYQATFEALLYGDVLDYAHLPLQFERYSNTDQARILSRLLAMRDAQASGQVWQPDAPFK